MVRNGPLKQQRHEIILNGKGRYGNYDKHVYSVVFKKAGFHGRL